jgi:hypothetical protein
VDNRIQENSLDKLTKVPRGQEMRWFYPLVKKLAFYHWFASLRVYAGQVWMGKGTPARRSLIKNVEIRSKSLGTEGSEGRMAHHTTTTGLMTAFLSSSVQIKIPCEDCHSIWLLDDSKTGKSQPILL